MIEFMKREARGNRYMKIHIIGGSGSGKTYLAENLSKKYGIRHYDLDDLQSVSYTHLDVYKRQSQRG